MIFLIKTTIVMLYFLYRTESIRFNNIAVTRDHEVLIEKLFSVTGKAYSVCFWDSEKSNEFLDFVFKQCFKKSISIYIVTKSTTSIKTCEMFVFFNVTSGEICSLFLNVKFVTIKFALKIVITNSSLSDDFVQMLENRSSSFDSASVTLITLKSGIMVLDYSFVPPRRLKSSYNYTNYFNSSLNKLHGRVINVATFHYPPFIEIKKNGSEVEYNGMEINLWKEVSRYLNCTWKIVEIEKGWEWGVTLENGTLVGGIVQALREGVADVSFCNIWLLGAYLKTMDFGPLMNQISLTFLVRRPHQLTDRWHNLVSVAQTYVWVTTLAALLAISAVYWCACALDGTASSKTTSPAESLLVMFGILTVSSSYVRSTSTMTRVVVLWWFFFTLLFTTAITSTIVTQLTLPLYSPRINTFQQLVEGDFYWTSSYYQDSDVDLKEFYFDVNNYWQMMFESHYRSVKTKSLEKLIKKDEKLVLPAQRLGSEYIVVNIAGVNNATDLNNFRVIKSSTRDTFTSFTFRKRSPYNELFTRTIQRFIQLGLWSYWKKNADQTTALRRHLLVEKDISIFSEPEQLTMQKMYPVFLLLFIGHTIVCIVFCIEYFI